MKESFLIYRSLYGPIKTLSLEETGLLFKAIFAYQIEGIVPDLPPMINMAFQFVKDQFDRDEKKYNEKCQINQRNGSKGGRPKDEINNPGKPNKPTVLKLTQTNPINPTEPDTDTDTDTDTETGSDTVSGTVSGTVSENEKKALVFFEVFYSCYPGTKRSLMTEYENFTNKNQKNKYELIHLLLPAIQKEKNYRLKSSEVVGWEPAWKNLSTWIKEKCWEQEFSEVKPKVHLTGKSLLINELTLKNPDKW